MSTDDKRNGTEMIGARSLVRLIFLPLPVK